MLGHFCPHFRLGVTMTANMQSAVAPPCWNPYWCQSEVVETLMLARLVPKDLLHLKELESNLTSWPSLGKLPYGPMLLIFHEVSIYSTFDAPALEVTEATAILNGNQTVWTPRGPKYPKMHSWLENKRKEFALYSLTSCHDILWLRLKRVVVFWGWNNKRYFRCNPRDGFKKRSVTSQRSSIRGGLRPGQN